MFSAATSRTSSEAWGAGAPGQGDARPKRLWNRSAVSRVQNPNARCSASPSSISTSNPNGITCCRRTRVTSTTLISGEPDSNAERSRWVAFTRLPYQSRERRTITPHPANHTIAPRRDIKRHVDLRGDRDRDDENRQEDQADHVEHAHPRSAQELIELPRILRRDAHGAIVARISGRGQRSGPALGGPRRRARVLRRRPGLLLGRDGGVLAVLVHPDGLRGAHVIVLAREHGDHVRAR